MFRKVRRSKKKVTAALLGVQEGGEEREKGKHRRVTLRESTHFSQHSERWLFVSCEDCTWTRERKREVVF